LGKSSCFVLANPQPAAHPNHGSFRSKRATAFSPFDQDFHFTNTANGLSLSSPAEFNSSILHEQIFNQQTSISNTQSTISN
jgi:hypothetical protein